MPSYAIFHSRSTPEIASQVDIKRGVEMGMSSSLHSLRWCKMNQLTAM